MNCSVVYPPKNCLAAVVPGLKKRKDTHTMKQKTVVEMKKSEPFVDDPLTAIVHQGAREILAKALEMEINNYSNIPI